MKKVLILAYDFPPYVSVGALRPHNWFKYFKEFGIYPIVVTRQWNNLQGTSIDYISESKSDKVIIEETEFGKIIQAPFKPHLGNKILLRFGENNFVLIRKLITAFFELMQFIFPIGPKYSLFKAADHFLKNNNVDLIIATGDPFILFKYTNDLSKVHKIKWVADYRDPWVHPLSFSKSLALNLFYQFQEKKTVKHSEIIVTVSELLRSELSKKFSMSDIHIISNGFNFEAVQKAKSVSQNNKIISIGFAGTIYKWHPIESILKVFNELIIDRSIKDFEMNFYGTNYQVEIQDLIQQKYIGLTAKIHFFSKLENEKLLKELAVNNCFLLFNDYLHPGTKIYDYLALHRKIIFCYLDDSFSKKLKKKYYSSWYLKGKQLSIQAELIRSTDSGIIVKDEEHLKKVLLELNQEFLTNMKISTNPKNYEIFSRKNQTEKLAEILKNVMR